MFPSFTLGCDPELLLHDGGKFISAIGIIPGTKEEPFALLSGKVHPDNVTAEFNTAIARDVDEFDKCVSEMIAAVENIVHAKKLLISHEAMAVYEEDQLEHPSAKEAGCSPDFDAYTGGVKPPPPLDILPFRSAGGHVHIGTSFKDENEARSLVKLLDLYITIPMLRHDNPFRRELYGQAGAYRLKPYGVEYRSPSNLWIFTEARRRWVYQQVETAIKALGFITPPDHVPAVINGHDVGGAEELMREYYLSEFPI